MHAADQTKTVMRSASFFSKLGSVMLLAFALMASMPAQAQDSGGDDEDTTHQYLLPPTRPHAECAGRIVFEAYKRYGLLGTVDRIPTRLLKTIAVGLPATIAYCNRELSICYKSARAFQDRIHLTGEGCPEFVRDEDTN